MGTPAHIDSDEVADAITRITDRHTLHRDPQRSQMGNTAGEVLDYLRTYGALMSQEVQKADLEDAMLLRVWQWWQDRRTEQWILERAEAVGVPNRRIGQLLGIASRQGVRDRRDRLAALLGPHRVPDEKLARGRRRNAAAEAQWRQQHAPEVLDVVGDLIDYLGGVLAADAEASVFLEYVADPVTAPGPDQAPTSAYMAMWCSLVERIGSGHLADRVPTDEPLGRSLAEARALARDYRLITGSSGADGPGSG